MIAECYLAIFAKSRNDAENDCFLLSLLYRISQNLSFAAKRIPEIRQIFHLLSILFHACSQGCLAFFEEWKNVLLKRYLSSFEE
jgi:hypothetical protein